MKKNKRRTLKTQTITSQKKIIIISILVTTSLTLTILATQFYTQTPIIKFSMKAAIIDQIGTNYPANTVIAERFNSTVTDLLQSLEFNVSYYKSQSITVEFLKGLAKSDFGIVILRAHMALRENQTIVDIFTSERFREDTYDHVTRGSYSWEPGKYYFAITPDFIENLEGSFPKSIIIAMGCNSLNSSAPQMAQAFIKKGAEAYIGWTGTVELTHTDNETIKLIQGLAEGKTLSEAAKVNYDPFYGSKMAFLPTEADNLTLTSLIEETKTYRQASFLNIENHFEHNLIAASSTLAESRDSFEFAFSPNHRDALKQQRKADCEETPL